MPEASGPIRLVDLIEHADSIDAHLPLVGAQQEFGRRSRRFLGVLEKERFVGVASAQAISEVLSLQFGHALFGREPVERHVLRRMLVVGPDVPLTDVFSLVAERDSGTFDEDVAVVAEDLRFLGLIPIHRLVRLQTSLLLENLGEVERQRGELAQRNCRMVDDLRMAREVQRALLGGGGHRTGVGDCWAEVSPVYEPAEEIGGDFFATFVPRAGVLSCFVGDVMGHGVRSALITAMLRAFVSEAHPAIADPSRLLGTLNADLCTLLKNVGELIFVTAAHVVIDLHHGLLHYAQAGHPRPLLWRVAAGQARELEVEDGSAGPALGLLQEAVYPPVVVPFGAGDGLLVYTDGLTEVAPESGEEFGVARLTAAFAAAMATGAPAGEVARHILGEAQRFSGSGFTDDVCMLVIRCEPRV